MNENSILQISEVEERPASIKAAVPGPTPPPPCQPGTPRPAAVPGPTPPPPCAPGKAK